MAQNWVQHALQRGGWRPRSQIAAFGVLGIIITLIFGAVYLSQIANYATTNREIVSLIAERDRLERQNEQLRAEIASLQTVPRLLERAEALGYRQASASDIEYIVIEGYNPNRSDAVLGIVEDNQIEVTIQYEETFQGWLQQQWDIFRYQFDNFGT